MLVEEDDIVEIDKIVSHRLFGDNIKYRIKLKGANSLEWVSEHYLNFYKPDMLELYNKENNIFNAIKTVSVTDVPNVNSHDENISDDSTSENLGSLGLIFAEQFHIKMEFLVDMDEDFSEVEPPNLLNGIQFGAAEYITTDKLSHEKHDLEKIVIKAESEIPSPTDMDVQMSHLNMSNSNDKNKKTVEPLSTVNGDNVIGSKTVKRKIISATTNNTQIVEPILNSNLALSNNDSLQQTIQRIPTIEKQFVPAKVIENNKNATAPATQIQSTKVKESENNHTQVRNKENNKESENISTKSNITIGKIKKATKPTSEYKSSDERKTVKSLLLPNQLSTTHDTIDKIFYNLPVVTKVVPSIPESKNEELQMLTISIISSIINFNNLALLHKYSLGKENSKLQLLVKNHKNFLINAINKNLITMVGALLELGADVNGRDPSGISPIAAACLKESEAIIDLLINNGASINVKADGKNVLLMKCISGNRLLAFRILLNAGIDFSSIESPITDPSSKFGMILEEHKKSLLTLIEEKILVQLGPHVKINKLLMSPHVLSLYEVQESQIEVIFNSRISAVIDKNCNLFFLITGLMHGNRMKLLISDANRVTSVHLNDIKQQSLTDSQYVTVTSFNPLKDERNKVVVRFDSEKCRKIRLVMVAYNVTIVD